MEKYVFDILVVNYIITRRLLRRSHWPQNEEIRAICVIDMGVRDKRARKF